MKKFILFFIAFSFGFCLLISANKISPAIDVIAYENSMVKSGLIYNGEIGFDTNDFDKCLGNNVKSITICTLPDESDGKLMLGNLYVVVNQVIEREDFSLLRFIPNSNDEISSSFTFEPNDSGYEIECSLKTLQSVNFSPVIAYVGEMPAWTQTNISYFNTLNGYDPEGDELRFEIVSYPKNGLVKLTNAKTGDYIYTPYADKTGTDSFSYRIRDSYGNYSDTYTVNVKIEKLRTSLVFSDMRGNKALNAALVLTSENLMDYKTNSDGTVSFNPDEKITREEFIVLLMNTMGAKDVPVIEKTRFADDEDIKKEYKGYIESAFALGIISGTNEKDGVHINPKQEITLAEASSIINRLIKAKNHTTSAFADFDEIPAWAVDDISSLNELGIIQKTDGKVNPNGALSRAQTAQILLSLLEYRGKIR